MRKLSNGMQKEILQIEEPCWKGQLERILIDNNEVLSSFTDVELADWLYVHSTGITHQQIGGFLEGYPYKPNLPVSIYQVPPPRKEITYSPDAVARKRQQTRIAKQLKKDAKKQLQLN